jgi:transcriptional regulator with GAF, ATPase, and Fis domain
MANVNPDKRIALPARFPARVANFDPGGLFRPVIDEACKSCSARAQHLTGAARADDVVASRTCAAAIVALPASPEKPDAKLSVVAELQGTGLCVITHASGVNHWPVSTRCKVLLAGARYLLDNREPGFRETLTATLAEVLAAVDERRGEEGRLRSAARARGIVGDSDALLSAFRQVVRMSTLSDLPVLVTGESGTGKELFASALHALDPKRSTYPLVAVNCAAINAGIAESELFGHVRGAFTGAGHDHSGFFLAAQGGVLFLDEIGELNLDVQAKILRVLQERRLFRVGAGHDAPVDIRIVAATNQDLAQMVKDGRFRADLFHRLNTLSVHISPLRERREDLPALVEHFVSAHASWREHTGIDPDLIDALSCLPLPGNVRELKNLITTAQATKTDRLPLGLKDLPSHVWKELAQSGYAGATSRTATPAVAEGRAGADRAPLPELPELALSLTGRQGWNLNSCLSRCEREIVAAALRKTNNNQSQAARLLGLTPRSIYNKLRKHDLFPKQVP